MDSLLAHLLALIRPGDTLWWGQATAEPLTLTRALVAHRALAQAGVLDILPSHYSHLPGLIRAGVLPVDVVLLQVSPPDEQGRYSLGLAQEYLPAALEQARVVIGEVNPAIPWTHGSVSLHANDFALLIDAEHPPLEQTRTAPGPVEQAIARHIATLIDDGATLQLGVGNLPEAVLAALHGHRDLGLHSGAVGDGIAALANAGVLTNAKKSLDTGVGIGGILMGSEKLRRWAHCNPHFQLRSTDYTHDPEVLAASHQLAAINAAIEVDLTGQINAEVAAGVYVGAVGGAVDFLRGAARSRGGLPIVALPATTKGKTRIVAQLSGPVSTARSDAGLSVTEHGVADLRGQTLSRRVRRLIDIAAPEHREELERQAHETLRHCGAMFIKNDSF